MAFLLKILISPTADHKRAERLLGPTVHRLKLRESPATQRRAPDA
jgi:hypothetical protein